MYPTPEPKRSKILQVCQLLEEIAEAEKADIAARHGNRATMGNVTITEHRPLYNITIKVEPK